MPNTAEVLTVSDRLSKRERTVYKVLHGIGLAWATVGLYWYVFADHASPSYLEAIVFAFPCLLVPVFGYALRSDTRIIHGVRWLREDPGAGGADRS